MSYDQGNTDEQVASWEVATFAGGCFWCMQPPFDRLEGVKKTVVGYTGGEIQNPTYEQVCAGTTGHAEAVQLFYDPAVITYAQLLAVFWHNVDPMASDRQFSDIGSQYRTAIFYHDEEQRRLAEISKMALEKTGKFNKPIATEIVPASVFYPAEEYHQKYYLKKPFPYQAYRFGSGREQFLKKTWGKPPLAEKE